MNLDLYKLPEDAPNSWTIATDGAVVSWSNRKERIEVIRAGVPYGALESLGKRMGQPVKIVLGLLGMPQTTYNKRKAEGQLLDPRHGEWALQLVELLDQGEETFNGNWDRFQRWLLQPNVALGDSQPLQLLDTLSGMEEVKNCLHRMEFGNMA